MRRRPPISTRTDTLFPYTTLFRSVRHAQRQIVVRVHSALRFRFKYPVIGLEARTDTVHVERAAAVGDINAMRAIAFHQRGLLRQRLWLDHVTHHQEARHIHSEIASDADMQIGSASCRKECVSTCRSRWSPYQ